MAAILKGNLGDDVLFLVVWAVSFPLNWIGLWMMGRAAQVAWRMKRNFFKMLALAERPFVSKGWGRRKLEKLQASPAEERKVDWPRTIGGGLLSRLAWAAPYAYLIFSGVSVVWWRWVLVCLWPTTALVLYYYQRNRKK